MGFDASGTFTRLRGNDSWKGDAAAGTKILSDLHDNNDNDIGNALSECLTKTGKSLPTVDIPWNGKKITNLGTPTQPGDAANRQYVDNLPGWSTSKNISGADLNGRLNFTAASGVNGITWTYADLSWVARHSVADKYPSYLTLNSGVAPNTTGDPAGDVFIIDEVGRINNNGSLSYNLSFEGANIRTISPGTGTRINYTNGVVAFGSNDVATITNKYATATIRNFSTFQNSAGSTFVYLDKSASGKYVRINASMAGKTRWTMDLGNATPETATERVGSDFYLYSYNNAGTVAFAEMLINRATHAVTFGGSIVSGGSVTSTSNFDSISTTCILSATSGGAIFLRPDGPTVSASGMSINTDGTAFICENIAAATGGLHAGRGLKGKAGYQGAYGGNWHNLNYVTGFVYVWVDATNMGAITTSSDHRIKKNVKALPSVWDKVKALRPVRYNHRRFRDLIEDDKLDHWGLIAHEVQETLTPAAAHGHKDEENVIQSINPLVMIAALTKALQEAMARIEKLEAA